MMQRSSRISERELPQKREEQFQESVQLKKVIRESLRRMGYEN